MKTHDEEARPDGWDDLGASWRAPAESLADVDLGAVRARSAKFARRIRWRNARELAAAVVVVVGGVSIAASGGSAIHRAGGVLMALGMVIVTGVLLWKGRNRTAPVADAPTRDVLAYERSELGRQADLLERVWLWYLGPLVPCIVAIYLDGVLRALETGRSILEPVLLFVGTMAVFVVIGWFNRRAARKLRDRMKALPDDSA